MSLSFTNITDQIDANCGTNSTSYTTAQKTADVNLGIDYLMLMLWGEGAGGQWRLDDSNSSGTPEVTTNLVSGTRTYNFTTDSAGNLILDIYKVYAKNSASGNYQELTPVGLNDAPSTMDDGQNATGTPTVYRKTGKGISLDLIPSYNSTDGLKVLINREGSYFVTTDTSKKWGFAGLYHEYLVLYASYQYARRKNLTIKETLKRDLAECEDKIRKHVGVREHDVVRKMTPLKENNR